MRKMTLVLACLGMTCVVMALTAVAGRGSTLALWAMIRHDPEPVITLAHENIKIRSESDFVAEQSGEYSFDTNLNIVSSSGEPAGYVRSCQIQGETYDFCITYNLDADASSALIIGAMSAGGTSRNDARLTISAEAFGQLGVASAVMLDLDAVLQGEGIGARSVWTISGFGPADETSCTPGDPGSALPATVDQQQLEILPKLDLSLPNLGKRSADVAVCISQIYTPTLYDSMATAQSWDGQISASGPWWVVEQDSARNGSYALAHPVIIPVTVGFRVIA